MKLSIGEKLLVWAPQIGAVVLMFYIAYKEFN